MFDLQKSIDYLKKLDEKFKTEAVQNKNFLEYFKHLWLEGEIKELEKIENRLKEGLD